MFQSSVARLAKPAKCGFGFSSNAVNSRFSSTAGLQERLSELIPETKARYKDLIRTNKDLELGKITLDSVSHGMRGMKSLIWDGSLLDPEEGVRIRGLNIPELFKELPKKKNTTMPLPESLLWLLLTAEIPSMEQTINLSDELHSRRHIPEYVVKMLDNCPKDLHPMTQLSMAVLALNKDSSFVKAYNSGIPKKDRWISCLDDGLNIISKIPYLAAIIYRNIYKNDKAISPDENVDWAANFSLALGFSDPNFFDMMRMYMIMHSDHEGGNISAHVGHLVGTALSDPFLSFSSSLNGLAGPLHGLANREVLEWIIQMRSKLNGDFSDESVKKYVTDCLSRGEVVPGFGHAVLRKTDPRYTCQREFALVHMKDDELFYLASKLYEIVPPILSKQGKVKNPWPNVDAHSGVVLRYFGLKEHNYYTVLFGVSRTLGILSHLVWARALEMPLERPKSVTISCLSKMANSNKN